VRSRLCYRQGTADFRRGDYQQAIAGFNRAAAYAALGDFERANADFDHAIELDPD